MNREYMDCFDYEFLCGLCPEVLRLHRDENDSEEYGLNWYEFIHTQELWDILGKWWDGLTEAEFTDAALIQLERTVARIANDEESLPILRRLAGRE